MEFNTAHDYIEVVKRRKWWIIIFFILVMMGSSGVYKILPKIYKATTLIMVQPQKVPTNYVRTSDNLSVSDRLDSMSQQILSRTSLEKVITELRLVDTPSSSFLMNQKVKSMRKAIVIDVHRASGRRGPTSAFTISFEDPNPGNAARIANKIASLFVTENLRAREEQVRSTSQFLDQELRDIEKRLKRKEEAIRSFKERYMGELPAQQDANLRILETLQRDVQTNNQSMIAAQQRKANLEIQIDQMTTAMVQSPNGQPAVTEDPLLTELNNQRRKLEAMRTHYTDQHPDVIAAKASIRKLEGQVRAKRASQLQVKQLKETNRETQEKPTAMNPMLNRLRSDLQAVIDQIDRLTREEKDLKAQIESYQRKVENAPKREEEMSILLRDYTLLQENYQSLLDKKIQAQLAENLERTQKGEQFKILDPATPPMYPFKPDRNKFFGFALVIALGLGGGLGFFREHMDRSFHRAEDVERFFGFPVIASIPRIEIRRSKES